jgi:hypothetical protein
MGKPQLGTLRLLAHDAIATPDTPECLAAAEASPPVDASDAIPVGVSSVSANRSGFVQQAIRSLGGSGRVGQPTRLRLPSRFTVPELGKLTRDPSPAPRWVLSNHPNDELDDGPVEWWAAATRPARWRDA